MLPSTAAQPKVFAKVLIMTAVEHAHTRRMSACVWSTTAAQQITSVKTSTATARIWRIRPSLLSMTAPRRRVSVKASTMTARTWTRNVRTSIMIVVSPRTSARASTNHARRRRKMQKHCLRLLLQEGYLQAQTLLQVEMRLSFKTP